MQDTEQRQRLPSASDWRAGLLNPRAGAVVALGLFASDVGYGFLAYAPLGHAFPGFGAGHADPRFGG